MQQAQTSVQTISLHATNIVLTLIKNENGIEGKKQSKRSKVSAENKFNIQC